jgi:hypothetical protein
MGDGANYADFARQLKYDKTNNFGSHSYYASYSTSMERVIDNSLIEYNHALPEDALKGYAKTKFETARKDQTSLFLIDSKNRDRSAFPQPTHFTLYPPRVYKNVTSIQVVQVKLLSSFFYFRAAKGNTFLPVIERGREAIGKFLGFPLTKIIHFEEGSYGISDLLNALQIQLNYTPLFYDYPTGFSGFVNAFTTNGDLSVNFNQPGDSYYDALNKKYITNPTTDVITSYYWGNRYAGLSQYTINQVKIAYYYPVLYELILDTTDTSAYPYLNLNVPSNLLPEGDTVYTHVIFNSSGLNDPTNLYLINQNLNYLDIYRLNHTFRYSLINRYQLSYDANSLRVNIVTISLNTSLVNLINTTNARNLATAIQNAGYSLQSYSNTSNALNQAKVIYSDMYNYIQKQMTTYLAIGYATYGSDYFLNTNNIIFTQNGLIASGVRQGYTAEYLASGQSPVTSTTTTYSNSPGYWPNFLPGPSQHQGGISSEGINPPRSIVPYSVTSSNFQYGLQMIDSSNYYLQTNRSSRSVDSLITIQPAKYTVFKFRSQTRQTLQVETLPLPYYYRFSDYNQQGYYKGVIDSQGSNMPQKYYSTPYEFLYSTTMNSLMDSSNYSSITLQDVASMPFEASFFSSPTLNMNVQSNSIQFEFTAPWPPGNLLSTGLYAYNTNLSFIATDFNTSNSMISTTFGADVAAYLYHDRGAFMADIGTDYIRKENPLHYIASNSSGASNTDLTISVSTFSGHRYYGIFRSQALSFGNFQFKPVVYTDSNYVNIRTDYVNFSPFGDPSTPSNVVNYPFVANYNPDFLQLPTQSTLAGIDPSNSKYATNVGVGGKPIGYDISGVSNDLTDYKGYIRGRYGFIPNSALRTDPMNTYIFQSITPFDSNAGSYFGPDSQNSLLQPVTNQTYSFKGTSSQQIKIVHWYDNYYIPEQTEDGITTSNTIGFSLYPSSIQSVVSGYPTNSKGNIEFGRGINAIGFMPTDGLYEVSSFMFKSAIYPLQCISTTAEDPNTLIRYVGVFAGSFLAASYISISSALTVLSYSRSHVYGPSTLALTPGFGSEKGTWYEFDYDPTFVPASNVKINGYTQGSNELLSYNSMYYIVPFNAAGSNITFSYLTGSVLPYPLTQVVSTSSNYFGQTVAAVPGTIAQSMYIMPSTISNPVDGYGPQGLVPYTQSQYEQSQPITTTSIGFREYQYLVTNSNALFPFTTSFSNSISTISTGYVGLTTYVSEYSDTLYLVNSLSNGANISNAIVGFQGAAYASSMSTSIGIHGGTTSSMQFLLNPCTILGNYSFTAMSNQYSTILFEPMAGTNSNITTRRFDIDSRASPPFITVWMWGAGGGTWYGNSRAAPSNQTGGAGGYVKAKINTQILKQQYGVSSLYFVVGKGGNRDNMYFDTLGPSIIQGYEQPRYGGGGTSIMETNPTNPAINNINIQGGGFTGIFLDSNLATGQPLLIVGGGGAGGAFTMGGPGGFGVDPVPLPLQTYPFSEVDLTTLVYTPLTISSLFDWNIPYNLQGQEPARGALSNLYNTSQIQIGYLFGTAYRFGQGGFGLNGATMDIGNGFSNFPSAVQSLNINYDSNVSTMSKLEIWAPGNANYCPRGIIVYSDKDKQQVYYSNLTLNPYIAGGIISQRSNYNVYTVPINTTRPNTASNTTAWITCGVSADEYSAVQYSYDGSNWAKSRTQTNTGTIYPISTINAIVYANPDNIGQPTLVPRVNGGGFWYACGDNKILRSRNGLDWSASGITNPYTGVKLTTLAAGLNKIVAGGAGGKVLYTNSNNGVWSNVSPAPFTNDITRIRLSGYNFYAISPRTSTCSIKFSPNAVNSWSNVSASASGLGAGAVDIAFNDTDTYVAAMGSGALPHNKVLIYGIGTPTIPPTIWQPISGSNLSNFTSYAVAFGNGVFVAAGSTTDGSSPVKYSYDGMNWSNTDVLPVTLSTRGTARYTFDNMPIDTYHLAGTTQYNSGYGFPGGIMPMLVRSVVFNSNVNAFITTGEANLNFVGYALNNNVSVMTSPNGINWNMTFDGGYNNNRGGNTNNYEAGFCADYGDISVIPNLSTLYVELWGIDDGNRKALNQIVSYGAIKSIIPEGNNQAHNLSTIYDRKLNTYWYPSESQNVSIQNGYDMTFKFNTAVSSFSKLTIYVPNDSSRFFTGLLGRSNQISDIFYNSPNIKSSDFKYDVVDNLYYYDAILIPPVTQVSTIYMTFTKSSSTSPQINEVQAVNDTNEPIVQYIPTSAIDYDGYPYFGAPSNMIDGNLTTLWAPNRPNPAGSIYKALFTFSTPAPRINYIQVYNDAWGNQTNQTCVTGIAVYTDPSKISLLYSNISEIQYATIGVQVGNYAVIQFNIIPITNVSQVYIEFYRNYELNNFPVFVNEVKFFNIGIIQDTSAGYTAGTITEMQRITLPGYLYDGGGGSNGIGGVGGGYYATDSNAPPVIASNGLNGVYLKGGSPATAGQLSGMTGQGDILFGAGGGGGGYYGGGGGGVKSYNTTGDGTLEGGGGGGGGGYFSQITNLVTLLDYGVAVPGDIPTNTPSNYIPPAKSVQDAFIASGVMRPYTNLYGYGAGGNQDESGVNGPGQHGAIIVNFDAPAIIPPIGTPEQVPSFVDGSALGLFNTSITYTDIRDLSFGAYIDSIQNTPYSNYNWVWYNTYLGLTGSSLNPSTMRATTRLPKPPSTKYRYLPNIVYLAVQQQFSNVSTFFMGNKANSNAITDGIEISFELLNQYLITTPYTDPSYVELTELYCILDYLRNPMNLNNPHVDSITSPLSRVFGGLPGFGYWANPFFTNVSYLGFDTGPSLFVPSPLANLAGSSNPVQAFYGLMLEQNLSSGQYLVKDIMAYKPSITDVATYGSNWSKVTQFTESYMIRSLSNIYVYSNVPVQPYTLKSAIGGNFPLFNYKVYTTRTVIGGITVDAPIQMINDFQSQYTYIYSFQNSNVTDISTIHLATLPLTSTMIQVNQDNITSLSNSASNIIGTLVSEHNNNVIPNTHIYAVTRFGFNAASSDPYTPLLEYSLNSSGYYTNYSINSKIAGSNVGKAITDVNGNFYVADRMGGSKFYENICTIQVYQQSFSNSPLAFASPSYILNEYNLGNSNTYYDHLVSRYKNIWHLQGTENLSTIYGARLNSPYDFTTTTSFANQIFYPTHKIVLTQKGAGINPITNTYDLANYPSYSRTQMFYYKNFTKLVNDISGQFAMENTSNFTNADTEFSGYFFNSFIQNINLQSSSDFNNNDPNTFNYLAIRAYSPSESFKALVRFYLPGRYDFGYISLKDLSNEIITLQSNANVNSDYLTVLGLFTSSFAGSKVFGSTGLPGFSGSTITTVTFGDFLKQYKNIYGTINTSGPSISSITGAVLQGQKSLITGDLQYIIPSYVANRERVYDPLEFSLPFSTIAQDSNRTIEEYSIGYNLGFTQADTPFNTIHRAGSFFKILDDYIYMKMNEEYNMNRLDISRQENYAETRDAQAESQLYNCKLILNNFGSPATTLIQNPVMFNPPIGKLDKLTFTWYDITGAIIDNNECEWSGSIQVVETIDVATTDSTIPKT